MIRVFIVALLIFLFFRGASIFFRLAPIQRNVRLYGSNLLSVAELLSWMAWLIWSVSRLYNEYKISALLTIGVITVILVIPMWYLLRDFLYGIVLKLQGRVDKGTAIETGNLKGVVLKVGYLNFTMKTRDGNIADIPYSKVMLKVLQRQDTNVNLQLRQLSLDLPVEIEPEELRKKLLLVLKNAPWIAASTLPVIKSVVKHGNFVRAEVGIHVLTKSHLCKIKDYVLAEMSVPFHPDMNR
ncbi:MAG: mechanosensitive ion channel [Lentimicrobium sp.]|jgi:hypothetical protein|nr:mechanosensitive ion channel [Lentimicrobium sp.]MDD2527062.1 mechanosensitive ion channel [Lentimicrobiaceae bacterium]MDY0026272.1 mechanosensitive ion channel [Lentimicrobium sp.]HAH56643.1 hypothetical protein [Bacteroidales bacterium]